MSTTTTDPRERVDRDPIAGPTSKLTEADSHFIASSSDRSYAEVQRTRRRRSRLVRFAVLVPLWVLSVVPLAREIVDGREGAAVVLAYLAVGAISLGIAVAIRGVYVLLAREKPIWSPSVFLMATVLAIAS